MAVEQKIEMKKKYKILEVSFEGKRFRIEEDYEEVGAYLIIAESGQPLGDYLQDKIEICKEQAHE